MRLVAESERRKCGDESHDIDTGTGMYASVAVSPQRASSCSMNIAFTHMTTTDIPSSAPFRRINERVGTQIAGTRISTQIESTVTFDFTQMCSALVRVS